MKTGENKAGGGFWKTVAVLCAALVVVAAAAIALYSCAQSVDLRIGGANARILDELNEGFVLDAAYEIEAVDIDGMYAERLFKKDAPTDRVILQLHGGAYIRGLNYRENLYQRMAQQYAMISGAEVLTIDYRIAPDNPYPAALEDAFAAYCYLLDGGRSGQDIVLAGDSAGGGLALALGLYLRDNGIELPRGIITMSAWTNLDYRRKKPAYVGDNDAMNPYISPIYGDFSGFPPMLMQVGTRDIKGDTVTVAQRAVSDGVEVVQTTYSKMVHVFQALYPRIEQANEAWREVEEFILSLYIETVE